MRTLYIPFAGDLYEILLDEADTIVKCSVARDNCGRPPEEIDIEDIPVEVIEKMVSRILKDKKDDEQEP